MIMINPSREEKFSCESETKAPGQCEALSKEFINPEKKIEIKLTVMCASTYSFTAPFTAAVNILRLFRFRAFALHGRLVKLESQTLTVVSPRSLLPLQITLALLCQFYSIGKNLVALHPFSKSMLLILC